MKSNTWKPETKKNPPNITDKTEVFLPNFFSLFKPSVQNVLGNFCKNERLYRTNVFPDILIDHEK